MTTGRHLGGGRDRPPVTAPTGSDGCKPLVLVVDDDPQLRRLIAMILGKQFTVLEAGDSSAAIATLDRMAVPGSDATQVSVVLLDVMLPGGDGISLCRRIKNEFSVPIIMCTARAAEEDVQAAIHNGADDYIAKPFDITTLKQKVIRHLRTGVVAS